MKVIKGLLNDFGARMGPGQVVFFPHVPKELRVVQTRKHPIPLGPISEISPDLCHCKKSVQLGKFGGYIYIRVPGIQRCRRRWVVFSWISRRTEPWVQYWIFFGCPKMDDVQRTFCEIFPISCSSG